MRSISYRRLVTRLLGVALVLASTGVGQSLAARGQVDRFAGIRRAATVLETELDGEYSGKVLLESVYTGELTDATPPNPADLGQIDLALQLSQSEQEISGHVVLAGTLVFTQEHEIEGLGVGPLVSGTFISPTLRLESEVFSWRVAEARVLDDGRVLPEEIVTRQFSVVSRDVQEDGLVLVGEYRETMWGLKPDPSTVVGTFTLRRPSFASAVSSALMCNFRANITQGPAPLQVAFTDLSSSDVSGWQWTFGDGGTATQQNPTHTYTQPGVYSVSLMVTRGEEHATRTMTDLITVIGPLDQSLTLPLVWGD